MLLIKKLHTVGEASRNAIMRQAREGFWRNPNNVLGYFNVSDNHDEDEIMFLKAQLTSMFDSLDDVYHNRWDCYCDSGMLFFLIEFPEIEIINRNNARHTLLDVFVCLSFTIDTNEEGDPQFLAHSIGLTRATLTKSEADAGYYHSHVPSRRPHQTECFHLGQFCLGTGDFPNTFNTLVSEVYHSDNFMLFILSIESFVAYESLEGGPHIRMSSIGTGNAFRRRQPYNEVVDIIYKEIISPDINFNIVNNQFRVINDEQFERYIHGIILEYAKYDPRIYDYLVKTVNGTVVNYSSANVALTHEQLNNQYRQNNMAPSFAFRDRIIEFKVIPIRESETISPDNYKVDQSILNHVCKTIEENIYFAQVRRSTIEGQNQLEYLKRYSAQDHVFVQSNQ